MVVISQSAEQQAGLIDQETLIFMGTSLGTLALILLAVALGLQLVRRGRLTPVRGRRTRIEPSE